VRRNGGACRREGAHNVARHLRLALAHVVPPEQELPVEVGRLDGVQVDLGVGTGALI
jgi:hypothetical protein